LNNEHPPLVKLMSALPLLPLHPQLALSKDETQVGIDFLYKNRVPADTLLFLARSMTIVLTLLGGLCLALSMRRRFGSLAAMAALAFYAFDPNLIAPGRYVTTDAPMAVFFFLVCAAWCEALLTGSARDLLLAAMALALSLTVKFSAILLLPVVAMLYGIRWWQSPKEFGWRRAVVTIAVTAGVCVAVILAVYWRATSPGPLAAAVNRNTTVGEALFRIGNALDVPAHPFLTGLDAVATHNQSGHPTYLLGQRSDTGWWYYFPVVFAV